MRLCVINKNVINLYGKWTTLFYQIYTNRETNGAPGVDNDAIHNGGHSLYFLWNHTDCALKTANRLNT
jgi:hypothetical protein